MTTLAQFLKEWEGKPLDTDGFPANQPFQCVDVPKQFNKELGYPPRSGNGKDWINNAGNEYTQIIYKPGAIPQPGDIISWNGSLPLSGGFGHVAVCISGTTNSFVSLDQNWAGAHYCRRVDHNYSYVQGWIRPKNLVQSGGDTVALPKQYLAPANGAGRPTYLYQYPGDPTVRYAIPNSQAFDAGGFGQVPIEQVPFPENANQTAQIASLNAQVADLTKQLADANSGAQNKEIKVSDIKSILLK